MAQGRDPSKEGIKNTEVFPNENQVQLNQELKEKHPEYQKLHDKLNFLEVRISEMKSNMEKKR